MCFDNGMTPSAVRLFGVSPEELVFRELVFGLLIISILFLQVLLPGFNSRLRGSLGSMSTTIDGTDFGGSSHG